MAQAKGAYIMPDVNVTKQAYLASCGTRCNHTNCLPLLCARVHRCEEEVKIGVDSEDGEDWKEFILGPKYKKRVFPPKKREREEKDK